MQKKLRTSWPFLAEEGLPLSFLFFVLLATLLLLFSRRPGDLLHAQFYAEDGKVWYAQAYNLHWIHSLLKPDEGYLHLLARLCTGPALLLPLRWAPLWMNVIGATIQALPVVVLLSSRCATWGSLRVRIVMALLYLASPNTQEIHVTLTNAQWHYALLQVLLAFGTPPRNRLEMAIDAIVFLVGGFTGPFDLVLLPLLLVFWWQRRQRWTLVLAGFLMVGAVFQLETMRTGAAFGLTGPGEVNPLILAHKGLPLGASVPLFIRITGGNLFLDSLVGFVIHPYRLPTIFLLLCLVLGVFVVACGLYWGPTPLRFFAVYAFILFAAALRRPLATDDVSMWHAMAAGSALRYCFLPMLVFVWSAVYALDRSGIKVIRLAGLAVLLLFLLGLRRWVYLPYDDHHFGRYVQRFEDAKAGTAIQIPLQPDDWFMTLVKH